MLYIGQLTIFKFLLLVTVVAEGLILRVTLAVTLDDGTKIGIAFVDVLLELDLLWIRAGSGWFPYRRYDSSAMALRCGS